MSNMLVTGGAGFIGANFVRFWNSRKPDDEIIVLDALTYAGNAANLDGLEGVELIHGDIRSEEHTSELQSLMRISYAVFCLKKKKEIKVHKRTTNQKQCKQLQIKQQNTNE